MSKVLYSKVQPRGEVVIPVEVRKHLLLDTDDFLAWEMGVNGVHVFKSVLAKAVTMRGE